MSGTTTIGRNGEPGNCPVVNPEETAVSKKGLRLWTDAAYTVKGEDVVKQSKAVAIIARIFYVLFFPISLLAEAFAACDKRPSLKERFEPPANANLGQTHTPAGENAELGTPLTPSNQDAEPSTASRSNGGNVVDGASRSSANACDDATKKTKTRLFKMAAAALTLGVLKKHQENTKMAKSIVTNIVDSAIRQSKLTRKIQAHMRGFEVRRSRLNNAAMKIQKAFRAAKKRQSDSFQRSLELIIYDAQPHLSMLTGQPVQQTVPSSMGKEVIRRFREQRAQHLRMKHLRKNAQSDAFRQIKARILGHNPSMNVMDRLAQKEIERVRRITESDDQKKLIARIAHYNPLLAVAMDMLLRAGKPLHNLR